MPALRHCFTWCLKVFPSCRPSHLVEMGLARSSTSWLKSKLLEQARVDSRVAELRFRCHTARCNRRILGLKFTHRWRHGLTSNSGCQLCFNQPFSLIWQNLCWWLLVNDLLGADVVHFRGLFPQSAQCILFRPWRIPDRMLELPHLLHIRIQSEVRLILPRNNCGTWTCPAAECIENLIRMVTSAHAKHTRSMAMA